MAQKARPEISELIREHRETKYTRAKDFWAENREILDVSYPHYSAVEAGTKFPNISLAIAIAKILKIQTRVICHVWAKSQMPTAELKSFFDITAETEAKGIPSTIRMNPDEFFIFTERHIPTLAGSDYLWDILSIIIAYSEFGTSNDSIAASLGLHRAQVKKATDWLIKEGLVTFDSGILRSKKKYFHLPNTAEFKEIRDQNFQRISKDLISRISINELEEKTSSRITYSRRITKKQAGELCQHIDELVGHFGNMDEVGTEFYSLTVALGPRAKFSGASHHA